MLAGVRLLWACCSSDMVVCVCPDCSGFLRHRQWKRNLTSCYIVLEDPERIRKRVEKSLEFGSSLERTGRVIFKRI